jgi:hypothetical protein
MMGAGEAAANVRPHNVTLTAEVWEHLVKHHGKRGVAAALENAYRAQHSMLPRPAVAERGRFAPGENAHTRRKKGTP